MNAKEIKEVLVGRIKWEINSTPSQELEDVARCYYFGACDLIHFAKDIGFFSKEQEDYFSSRAITAYKEALKNQSERKNDNV